MSSLQTKVAFDTIRYGSCWEDADLLVEGVQPRGKNILCIASAGDNALALLAAGAESVHAIDISAVQLYLTELKRAAFTHLDYEGMLQLLGLRAEAGKSPEEPYRALRSGLSPGARSYWDGQGRLLRNGVLQSGKLERYFRAFRTGCLPLVHSGKTLHQLLAPKDKPAQEAFYREHWNTWRWKLLMQLFFSRQALGRYGRDPEFLRHVTVPVPQFIRLKAEAHLQSTLCQENYFLRMIFTGSYGETLPLYLRRENFGAIQAAAGRLTIEQVGATEAVQQKNYDAYCLSNIFEYMAPNEFSALAAAWRDCLPEGGILAYWNLMAPRSFSELQPGHFRSREEGYTLSARDKGFFYSRFILEQKG